MKKKRRKVTIVPPLGPATNVRPAGAHKSKKLYDRNKMKAVFRKEEDGFFYCVRRRYNVAVQILSWGAAPAAGFPSGEEASNRKPSTFFSGS